MPKMKAGTPRSPKKPGRVTGARYWDLFTDAHKKFGHRWVNIEVFGSNRAFAVKRAIERGEYPVPGGVKAWEIKAVKNRHDDGSEESELWIKRKAKA
jgi:hypothetical protein